jgi:hypothetical protein
VARDASRGRTRAARARRRRGDDTSQRGRAGTRRRALLLSSRDRRARPRDGERSRRRRRRRQVDDDDDDDAGGGGFENVGPALIPSVSAACLGAFLFGYHSAVINAPLSAIAEDLGFAGDNVMKGAVVSGAFFYTLVPIRPR